MLLLVLALISADPTNIAARIKQINPGDTMTLARGDYGNVSITGKQWTPAINIIADGAVFNNLKIVSTTGVTLTGGTWKRGLPKSEWLGSVYILKSADISLSKIGIDGEDGSGNGLFVRDSKNVSLVDATITRARVGIGFLRTDGGLVKNTVLTGFAIDGIDVASSHGITIDNIKCVGNMLVDQHHPDCVQLWSIKGDQPTSDIIVRNSSATGAMQGFSGFDHNTGGFDRITIENNVANVSYPHGVALNNMRDSRIMNNNVSTPDGAKYRTGVNVKDYDPLTVICGNYSAPGAGKQAIRGDRCKKSKSARPS